MEVDTVLVPADASEEAARAVRHAGAIADAYDAGVHVLYVLDEQTTWELESGSLDPVEVAERHETFMTDAEELVPNAPVTHSTASGFTRSKLSQHPGSVILDSAAELAADFLVVPREPVTGDPGEVLGKAAEYVLAYASQPVLSV